MGTTKLIVVRAIKTFYHLCRTTRPSAHCGDACDVIFHLVAAFNALAAVDDLLLLGFVQSREIEESIGVLHEGHAQPQWYVAAVFSVHIITSKLFLAKG